jgi:peroxiredoxin
MTRYYGEIRKEKADVPTETAYLENFKKTYGLPYDIAVAKGQANQINYGAQSIPTTVLIDRKGVVRYVEIGTSADRNEEIRKVIVKLLAEK